MRKEPPTQPVAQPGKPASGLAEGADADRDAPLEEGSGRVHKGYPKGAKTQERMISATQDAIYELGFSRASSREIARRSGVTFGVIQHHFGTFEALLLSTGEHGTNGIRAVLANAEVQGETTEEKLTCIADLVWDYFSRPAYISYVEICTNLIRDPSTSEEALERMRAGIEDVEKLWLDLMRRTFDTDHNDLVLRRLLFGTMQGLAITRWTSQERPSMAQERRLFVAAIAAHLDNADATAKAPK
jgi:AcrR family transcriptional regulator